MTTSNFQINICPLKSLIAAAAHSLICCSLYVLTSSPFFFPLPWSREFVASKLHSVTAKQTTFCAFCIFFPHFSFHDWDFLFTYYRPSSFDLKLPLSVLSCTTPDSKNFDINFNDGGSKSQVLFVSSVSCLWVVECICLSLILFVNWLFKDLECKRWYHSLQL